MIEYFVSSTFRDMQAERDALRNSVLPEIKRYANVRGEDIGFMDLRWGINTDSEDSDENMTKVLSVCLDDIDRCQPQMIVLLGDRYGSVPSEKTLERFMAQSAAGIYGPEALLKKSVTEIEITHGILRHGNAPCNITVCIREPLDYGKLPPSAKETYDSVTDEEREKLRKLKETLISKYPDRILFYSAEWNEKKQRLDGLDDFIQKMTKRLKNDLDAVLPEKPLSEEEKRCNRQAVFDAAVRTHFCGREQELETFGKYMRSHNSNLFVLLGACGMGKSYFCSKAADIFRESCFVIQIRVSYRGQRMNSLSLLKQIIHISENYLGTKKRFDAPESDYNFFKSEAKRLIKKLSSRKKVLIIVDDIDKLYPDKHKDTWDYLAFGENENLKLLISASPGYKEPEGLRVIYKKTVIELNEMDKRSMKSAVAKTLSATHKELPEYAIDAIMQTVRYRSPYYLNILMHKIAQLSEDDFTEINRLSEYNPNGNENLYGYIRKIIHETPITEKDALISFLENLHCGLTAEQAARILRQIGATENGLRSEDVYNLSQGSLMMADISRFFVSAQIILQYDDSGKIHFCNEIARDAAEIYTSRMGTCGCEEDLFAYLKKLPAEDAVKKQEFVPLCFLSADPASAARYLSETYLLSEERLNDDAPSAYDNTVIESVRNAITLAKYKDLDFYEFFSDMIKEAQNFSHRECYGFVSAILFSYDTLFDPFSDERKSSLMSGLYELAITRIYPRRECNFTYLRTVYICCEQYAIRSTDFLLRRNLFREFLTYCKELSENMPKDYAYRNYIYHDLSIAYEKNAEAIFRSSRKNAMLYYEQSLQAAEKLSESAPFFEPLKNKKYDALISRASEVIKAELMLKNNGLSFWDEDELRSVIKDLERIAKHFETNANTLSEKRLLREAYLFLSAGKNCLDDKEKAYRILLSAYQVSKEICSESDLHIDLDRYRYVLTNLCSYDRSDLPFDQKSKWLAEALDYAKIFAATEKNPDGNSFKILFYSADNYFKHIWSYIERRDSFVYKHIMSGYDVSDEIKEVASVIIEFLKRLTAETVRLIYKAPLQDEIEAFYHKFIKILSMAKKYQDYLRVLAIQAYKKKDYTAAIERAALSLDMCNLQENYINTDIFLSDRLDICDLLCACYHGMLIKFFMEDNGFVYGKDSEDYAAHLRSMKSYYLQMQMNDCKMYDLTYPDNTLTAKYKDSVDFEYDSFPGAIMCTSLLCSEIAKSPDAPECKLFWDDVSKNEYYIGGQKYHFTHLNVTEDPMYSKTDEKFRILTPEMLSTAGKYLCERIGETRVLRLLYLSDWFECIALEYAYRHGMDGVVKTIIENGYDRYLELPFLYILRKYDRFEYERRVHELKLICHRKNIGYIKRGHSFPSSDGNEFFSEYTETAKKIIADSKNWAENDPRFKEERSNQVFRYYES